MKAWFGNQYYNTRKGKWVDGKQPKRVKLGRSYLPWVIICLILSVIGTIVLNHYYPGTYFIIF
ncbi:hypothetical protein LCGC14_1096280 [marine sediment metagenome]|uniref:Uncharacterized protein n=1 Tax=marine sediment metagenome TaxID=412755 RepID=A0A0F9MYL2_9ZZZZ